MKKTAIVILILFLTSVLCSFSTVGSKDFEYGRKLNSFIEDDVSYNVTFTALAGNSKLPVEGVKLILINNYGEAEGILTTDKNGQTEKKIAVPLDKRYFSGEMLLKARGTLTVIAYKEGYCETVIFEIPVSPSSRNQQFLMYQMIPGQRNEPYVQMGDSHHLEILLLVDKYRKYINEK